MSSQFSGAFAKVRRAAEQMTNLKTVIDNHVDTNVPVIVIEPDPVTGDKIAKLKLQRPIPDTINLAAGEIIYHLRSALDHTAIAVARLSQVANEKTIYFPTGPSLTEFEREIGKKLRGVAPHLVDAIKETKPYGGGNEALRAVFEMANVDKHIELIPIIANQVTMLVSNLIIHGTLMLNSHPFQSLDEGIPFANLGKTGSISARNTKSKLTITVHVCFGQSACLGRPIIPTIDAMIINVGQAIDLICDRAGSIHGNLP
ncbi:hypothetical protein [Rhizobium sp.]|uniref:hypothetical protein n=1 Tax=Rhizobium sp. TaxID=391 RepID=UPI000E8EA465|nr:hypothetical protein [Rhizobium sp.]